MPRKNGKRKYKKRKGKKKKTYVPLPVGGFTNSKLVRLRWAEEFTMDCGSNSYIIQTFLANSPSVVYMNSTQIPNAHQPANYDVWARRYNSHVVLGSKCNIRYTPSANQSITPGYVGCWVGEGADAQADLATLLTNGAGSAFEQKYTQRMYTMGPGSSAKPQSFTTYFSPSKVFGQSKSAIKNDTAYHGHTATASTSVALIDSLPIEQAYFNLFVASIADNNPGAMTFMVIIEYIVRFYGLEEQSPS